jgi:hypothetical protein
VQINESIIITLITQGPTRVLQIHDSRTLKTVPVSVNPTAFSGLPSVSATSVASKKSLNVSFRMASFGVSLIDHTPQELIYVSIKEFVLNYTKNAQQDSITLSVGRVQIDNQLWSASYPSLLYPLIPFDDSLPSPSNRIFLALSVIRDFSYPGTYLLTYSPNHLLTHLTIYSLTHLTI